MHETIDLRESKLACCCHELNWKPSVNKDYRKRPCISRTFFHKIEAKNRGCGLSMDTSVFGLLKNPINIHKTSGAEKET